MSIVLKRLPTVIKTGDLRHPVALVRSERQPDGATGFTTELTPYRDEFCYIQFGEQKITDKEDAEPKATHWFVIRFDPTLLIGVQDRVVWEGTLYRILSTERYIDKARHEYLVIAGCAFAPSTHGTVTEGGVDNTKPAENSDPFWKD